MGFSEIVGHSKQLESIRAALANERLHHAFLFMGPEGVGKRTIALALAKAVHCSESSGDYCGRCIQCASIMDNNHPDVRVVQTLESKKEISIQQVREIERDLRLRSFSGKQKIAIVDNAELMNAAAQNALLKTLEEPPNNSLIVLVTPNAGGLLPTLRSRCFKLGFATIARADLASFLQKQHQIDAADAELLAAISMGSIGVALKLDPEALFEKRRAWVGMLTTLKRRDYRGAMTMAEVLAASREEALEFLGWTESWYRDLLICRVSRKPQDIVNLDMLSKIEEHATQVPADDAIEALLGVTGAVAGIQRNLNRRMVLEKFLFGVVETRS